MIVSSTLVAKLPIRHFRNDRVTRRIVSLSEAASNTPSPAVSVFRRNERAERLSLDAATAARLGRRIARALQTPTAGIWAPAN
jgi:hypothetical protein